MRVLDGDTTSWRPSERGSVVAIGVFDGVHRGHRAVIDTVVGVASARDHEATVLTFDRHPLSLIAPDRAPHLLTTLSQKRELLAHADLGATAILTFDEASRSLDGDEFAEKVLLAGLDTRVVVAGPDFRFGRDRSGTVDTLVRHGIEVEEVPLVGEGSPISSTAIRSLLADGDVEAAAALLGRWFAVEGAVARGGGRGATIGFPTANLALDTSAAIPARGVYAVIARVGGGELPGVSNVGVRPTFDGSDEVVEVHLLDIQRDLYGQELHVAFLARLRDEQRFDGPEALAAQIARDVAAARSVHGMS